MTTKAGRSLRSRFHTSQRGRTRAAILGIALERPRARESRWQDWRHADGNLQARGLTGSALHRSGVSFSSSPLPVRERDAAQAVVAGVAVRASDGL
jgi:hypothetical protein